MEEFDIINKPSHYCEGRKYEPIEVIKDWDLNFNLGNVIKYISRVGRKDDSLQELKKARVYLDHEIKYIEKKREKLKDTLEHLSAMAINNENMEEK